MVNLDAQCQKIARWASDHEEELRNSDPMTPEGLNDRSADNWRPLLAIADCVGGDWPERARQATKSLEEESENDEQSKGLSLIHI